VPENGLLRHEPDQASTPTIRGNPAEGEVQITRVIERQHSAAAERKIVDPDDVEPQAQSGEDTLESCDDGSVHRLGHTPDATAQTHYVWAVTRPLSKGLLLTTLILGAGVANVNLSLANVALPDISRDLQASQVGTNLVGVGFTLGLAASVLYLGALGDRYGRKRLLLLGLTLSIPFAVLAAFAPNVEILVIARILGGVAAGMTYPTTLTFIVALFDGKARTTAIALWSGIGAAFAALGPPFMGLLLEYVWWGGGFLIPIPLALLALVLALRLPNSTGAQDDVDKLSGLLSIVMITTLVLAITFAPMPGAWVIAVVLALASTGFIAWFVVRQRTLDNPLYDLAIAKRRIFWVAALAGMIVFGSLMGAFFIGQQYLQDVLGYGTFGAGLSILPTSIMLIAVAPVAARMIPALGSRMTMLIGFAVVAAGFLAMLTWRPDSPVILVLISYALLGAGVSIGAAPASRSIMAAVPQARLGMGSATNDLQRDLGGAIMQSVMGSLLVVRYAASLRESLSSIPEDQRQQVTDQSVTLMTSSFAGAEQVAQGLPSQAASTLMQWAADAFARGSGLAFAAALVAVAVGMVLVAFGFPRKDAEVAVEEAYAASDPATQKSAE
jgi:MFS transporter, DHA2 family, multidrug resistance protein